MTHQRGMVGLAALDPPYDLPTSHRPEQLRRVTLQRLTNLSALLQSLFGKKEDYHHVRVATCFGSYFAKRGSLCLHACRKRSGFFLTASLRRRCVCSRSLNRISPSIAALCLTSALALDVHRPFDLVRERR
jgi:hypothetical protein